MRGVQPVIGTPQQKPVIISRCASRRRGPTGDVNRVGRTCESGALATSPLNNVGISAKSLGVAFAEIELRRDSEDSLPAPVVGKYRECVHVRQKFPCTTILQAARHRSLLVWRNRLYRRPEEGIDVIPRANGPAQGV